MNKEYIEREEILKQITKIKDNFSPTVRPMFDVFKHITTEAPAADVAPVRHGKWVFMDSYADPDTPVYACSACHKSVYDKYISAHKYCLHCGAKMNGGNK